MTNSKNLSSYTNILKNRIRFLHRSMDIQEKVSNAKLYNFLCLTFFLRYTKWRDHSLWAVKIEVLGPNIDETIKSKVVCTLGDTFF